MSAPRIIGASTNNGRRPPGRPIAPETIALMEGLEAIVATMAPMSVRGAFYQPSTQGLVPKTEAGYRKVQRALVKLRENYIRGHRKHRWRKGPARPARARP